MDCIYNLPYAMYDCAMVIDKVMLSMIVWL